MNLCVGVAARNGQCIVRLQYIVLWEVVVEVQQQYA